MKAAEVLRLIVFVLCRLNCVMDSTQYAVEHKEKLGNKGLKEVTLEKVMSKISVRVDRTALITNAVTGKNDMRGIKRPQFNQLEAV
ncbi:hypothetical protein [Leptothoe spongobia]|uniref:Uncharacterized protein n=1 Tax=Leptothoe spongobia TAU-MAC 1115 TaxID=1967444 RepID=A0A947GHI9_9CYAN|nr:hypothetical protein [Leptothoe spongobia]MBT9314097.1 hypothetical protein [Leptothoe spongobia TAU-MAC 1115]